MIERKISELAKQLENAFGSSISFAKDCEKLSDDILLVTGEKISSSTLRRIFGLLKSQSQPSAFTINLLKEYLETKKRVAQEIYVSSHNLDEIANHCKEMIRRHGGINHHLAEAIMGAGIPPYARNSYFDYLFPIAVEGHKLQFLMEIYKAPAYLVDQPSVFSSIGKSLATTDDKGLSLVDELAKSTQARLFLFERYVATGSFVWYKHWIDAYLKYEKEPLKKLWAKTLKAWGNLLSDQPVQNRPIEKLYNSLSEEITNSHPYIQARIYGLGLSLKNLKDNCESHIEGKIRQEIDNLTYNNTHFPLFSIMILTYLLYCNHPLLKKIQRVFAGYQVSKKTEHDYGIWYVRKLLEAYHGENVYFSPEEVSSISIGFTDENYMVKYAGAFFLQGKAEEARQMRNQVIKRSGFVKLRDWQPGLG